MNKETKILVAIAYVIGVYLILRSKKSSENKVVTSNPSTTTPNIVPAQISPNIKSPIIFPKGLLVENIPIVKQTPFAQTPVIEKAPIIDYTNYKPRPIYKMTDAEWAACQKDAGKCKM